jgi:hypothetical protein
VSLSQSEMARSLIWGRSGSDDSGGVEGCSSRRGGRLDSATEEGVSSVEGRELVTERGESEEGAGAVSRRKE